jgi:hypothetical protein
MYFCSTLTRPTPIGWPTPFLLHDVTCNMGGSSGSRPTLLRFGCGFFLWHHNHETTILLTFGGGDGPHGAGNGGVLWLSLVIMVYFG